MTAQNDQGIVPNATRLLLGGFLAILAAGVGFAIRGGIFDNWVRDFNFTSTEIGLINGAGFTGFCFGIIIGGIVVDKIGYGKLVLAAFLMPMEPGPSRSSAEPQSICRALRLRRCM